MIRHAWTSLSCILVMLSLLRFVVDAANHESATTETVGSYTDLARSRQRRSCSEPYTMSNFIRLIHKIEINDLSIPTKRVSAYLRGLAYNSLTWRLSCGKTETALKTGLNSAEIELLRAMIGHSSNSTTGLETGVLLAKDGTVAVGHVITGIDCGGFNRDTQVTIAGMVGFTSDIDNLFQATISGDIGQTTLLHYAYPKLFPLLGPSGDWDSTSCPRVYTLNPKAASELTDAEILGDMDGAILGTIIPLIKDKPLSEIFQEYYDGSGIHTGGRTFKASDNAATFGELISNHELEAQSVSFTKAFYNSKQLLHPLSKIYNGTSKTKLIKKVPSTVQTFFKNLYLSCPGVLKRKHTISYFIGLVKQLEKETRFGIRDMTFAILKASNYDFPFYLMKIGAIASYSYTNSFASYVMREMVTHQFANNDKKRELGVVDAGGEAVTIESVLVGVLVGATFKTKPSGEMTDDALSALHKTTVAGSLASVADRRGSAKRKSKEIMGTVGYWDSSRCPPEYRYRTIIKVGQHTTRAELLGGIDGFVLGKMLSSWLSADNRLKLSFVLERYYGSGYKSVSSKDRLEQFNTLIVNKNALFRRIKLACRTYVCQQSAQDIANTFYKTMEKSTVDSKTGSRFLADYRTLVAVYPGDTARGGVTSGDDLRKKLTGNLKLKKVKTLAATDGLRLSYMLNQLDGHHIPKTQSQGAFIATDNNVYIFDLVVLKTYLTKTYKDPPLTAASVTTFKGERGIMMLDVTQSDGSAGSVGLWDGNKMHQITDYTKSTSVRTVTFWKTKGCASLAETGNCEFYNCVDNAFPCRDDGYAVGYGYRYCNKFSEHYDKFTNDGKVWVDEVRKCLMETIAPFYKGGHDCDTIKRVAFDSHVGCYLKSGVGFCKMAQDASNWDALWAVYEVTDFVGADYAAAWKQVLDTSKYCVKRLSKSVFDQLRETIKGGYEKLKRTFKSSQEDGTTQAEKAATSECIAYANAGDCRFYRCFQQRFPCDVFGASHVTDFEFQLCEDLNMHSKYFDSQGRQWTKATNKCLMQKLLPLYRQASVVCIDLHAVLFQDRIDCLVDSGFCRVTDSTHNRWAIDRGTDLASYPALLPDKAGLSMAGREYFYSELSSFRRMMGYANIACHAKGLKQHETFYARVRTESGYRLMEQN